MALSGQDLVFKFCNFLRMFQNLEFGTERLKHRLSVINPSLQSPYKCRGSLEGSWREVEAPKSTLRIIT